MEIWNSTLYRPKNKHLNVNTELVRRIDSFTKDRVCDLALYVHTMSSNSRNIFKNIAMQTYILQYYNYFPTIILF